MSDSERPGRRRQTPRETQAAYRRRRRAERDQAARLAALARITAGGENNRPFDVLNQITNRYGVEARWLAVELAQLAMAELQAWQIEQESAAALRGRRQQQESEQ